MYTRKEITALTLGWTAHRVIYNGITVGHECHNSCIMLMVDTRKLDLTGALMLEPSRKS